MKLKYNRGDILQVYSLFLLRLLFLHYYCFSFSSFLLFDSFFLSFYQLTPFDSSPPPPNPHPNLHLRSRFVNQNKTKIPRPPLAPIFYITYQYASLKKRKKKRNLRLKPHPSFSPPHHITKTRDFSTSASKSLSHDNYLLIVKVVNQITGDIYATED